MRMKSWSGSPAPNGKRSGKTAKRRKRLPEETELELAQEIGPADEEADGEEKG